MTKLNERIVEWHYAHDADITLGELHVSKTAKILLISLICVLLVAIGLGIYFRGYIYDYIVQPSVELKENSIDLEVFSEFDPNDYISKNSEYLQDINSNVDMSTLGTYQVVYTSKNRIKTIESVLTVNVVDTTDPELILLNDGVLIAVKNSEELQNFDPQDYIVYCHDNYDPNPQIEYTTPNPKLFTEEGQVNITYSCVDSSGNQTSAVLTVVVQEDFASQIQDSEKSQEEIDKLQKQLEEQQKQLEEQQKQIDEQKKELEEKKNQPTPTPVPTTQPTDPSKTTDPSHGAQTTDPKPTNPKPTNPPSGEVEFYADDVTWSLSKDGIIGTADANYLLQRAASKVHYSNPSGEGTAWPISGYKFQPSAGSTYTITWQCTEGLTCTQNVTITE